MQHDRLSQLEAFATGVDLCITNKSFLSEAYIKRSHIDHGHVSGDGFTVIETVAVYFAMSHM